MLLLYPPLTKACEPPGGLPILGGVLKSHNIPYKIIDMNCEGQNYLLDSYFKDYPKKAYYRELLTSHKGYLKKDTYIKAIKELSKGLNYNKNKHYNLTLSNMYSSELSSLNSSDLIRSSKNYKDDPFYEYYKKRLTETLESCEFRYIGISLQYINQALTAFSLIGFIKEYFPNIKIVLGGGLITSWVKSPNWQNPFSNIIDHIITGPGEEKLLRFLGAELNREKIKKVVPDFSFTKGLKYFSPETIIPITGSYGCSWQKCKFCPEVAEGAIYKPQKASLLIKKIDKIKDLYKPGVIHFLDNEISPRILKDLSKYSTGFKWYGFTKFYKELLDPEFCKKLKSSGCFMLKLGLESGDQNVLNSMNKGIKIEEASIILKNLKTAGIKTYVYLLFGTPFEEEDNAIKTRDFIIEHKDCITYLNLSIFNLPLGSDLAKELKVFKLSGDDLSLYSGYKHPKGWDRGVIRRFLNSEFYNNSEIKKIITNLPLQFNANHTPFFT